MSNTQETKANTPQKQSRKPIALAASALIAIAVVLAVALTFMRGEQPLDKPRNLLFILVDTLRTDAMGYLGSKSGATPYLDELAASGTAFENAWVQGTYTRASFLSFMTSAHVRTIDWDFAIPGENPPPGAFCERTDLTTLAEVLSRNGFTSNAIVGNTFLFPKHGFPRGFHKWNRIEVAKMAGQKLPRWGMKKLVDDAVVKMAIEEIERWSFKERRFAYVHLMDPHLPHQPPRAVRKRFNLPDQPRFIRADEAKRIGETGTAEEKAVARKFYEASVYMADRSVKRIMDALRQTGHDRDTLVVFAADHGEQIYEHGEFNHNAGVWEQLAHVPFILSGPGIEKRRVSRPVQLLDMAPTVLRLLEVPERPKSWQGKDLFNPGGETFNVSERLGETTLTKDARFKAIIDRDKNWRLFDLEKDRTEQNPIANDAVLNDLKARYNQWLKEIPRGKLVRPKQPRGICSSKSDEGDNTELMEQLKALGYVTEDKGPPKMPYKNQKTPPRE